MAARAEPLGTTREPNERLFLRSSPTSVPARPHRSHSPVLGHPGQRRRHRGDGGDGVRLDAADDGRGEPQGITVPGRQIGSFVISKSSVRVRPPAPESLENQTISRSRQGRGNTGLTSVTRGRAEAQDRCSAPATARPRASSQPHTPDSSSRRVFPGRREGVARSGSYPSRRSQVITPCAVRRPPAAARCRIPDTPSRRYFDEHH